jgi:hypothetical protein
MTVARESMPTSHRRHRDDVMVECQMMLAYINRILVDLVHVPYLNRAQTSSEPTCYPYINRNIDRIRTATVVCAEAPLSSWVCRALLWIIAIATTLPQIPKTIRGN